MNTSIKHTYDDYPTCWQCGEAFTAEDYDDRVNLHDIGCPCFAADPNEHDIEECTCKEIAEVHPACSYEDNFERVSIRTPTTKTFSIMTATFNPCGEEFYVLYAIKDNKGNFLERVLLHKRSFQGYKVAESYFKEQFSINQVVMRDDKSTVTLTFK